MLANQTLLTLAGLWPRSRWLGANWTRLPAAAAQNRFALSIDDGPDPEVTPRVLDILDSHGAKATFFCIGEKAARHPELCREIVRRGHAIENHSQHHRYTFALLGIAALTREIESAQMTLAAITGRTPAFFRAPAGIRSPLLDPVLARLGLQLVAWTGRGFDTRTPDAATVYRRLIRNLEPGAIFLLHDGNSARTPSGVPVIIEVLPRVLEAARSAGLHCVTLADAMRPDQQ
jgi:peptidoglycan/xylan/chitin deacetylase (PgdA/CDA1 family)